MKGRDKRRKADKRRVRKEAKKVETWMRENPAETNKIEWSEDPETRIKQWISMNLDVIETMERILGQGSTTEEPLS